MIKGLIQGVLDILESYNAEENEDGAKIIRDLREALTQPYQWQPIKLSDAPAGVEEIYPDEYGYQFLAQRGNGSAKGNQGWLITLPTLPTEGV